MDIATGAIGNILSKLADLLEAEYMLQTGVKDQINSLTKELESAQTTLQEIDQVHPDQLNNIAKIWAREVREASYDMEDILDTFLVRVKGPSEPIKKEKKKLMEMLLEKMATLFSKMVARHHIAGAIADIMKRLQEARERRDRYPVDSFVPRPSQPSRLDPRLAAVYKLQVKQPIGIEKSRGELESLLSSQLGNELSDNKLKIVSVVGVGGLGKTTLAKVVYDNLKGQFSCCAFVPIGRNPDMKKVFRDILIELDKDKYTKSKFTVLDKRQLIDELRLFLAGKRYFIVIDDVWDINTWETITCALVENNNNGSRIIVTTRNSEVATRNSEVATRNSDVAARDAYHQYKLRPLSDDDSKRLFYTRIFGAEEDKYLGNQRHEVSEVADKILKKCGGVPLAIMTMSGYLEGKSMHEWSEVCSSTGFCGKDEKQTIDTEWILSLSYYDLPSHLKMCLLYLSVFPEDHLISKDALIWMWIAEGFVDNNGKRGGLFEIGEEYFNELINRSLIQPVEEEINMFIEGCRVHDMILDLIRSLSREANFAMVLDSGDGTSTGSSNNVPRRLALQNRMTEDTRQGNCTDTTRARSLIAFSVPRVQLERFKILRVLYLDGCGYTGFDKHVGDLHHLRCLGIVPQSTRLELPKEIGELKFLLVLYMGGAFGSLPSSVGMLTQLVCLHAPNMDLPGCTIKDLRSLQVLRISTFEDGDVSKKDQFVKDLCNLSKLRVLVVRNCGIRGDKMESDLSMSIGNLQKLRHLDVKDYFGGGLPSCIHPPHLPVLSHLFLNLSSLSDNDLEILGSLPQLSYLGLYIDGGRATLTGTADRGYFQKLRTCLLPRSMVHFAVNEDSSVSFTIWHQRGDAPAFSSNRVQQGKCRAARGAIMPNLEALSFEVNVQELTACNNGSCDNLGLEYLVSLQKVTVLNGSRPDAGADVEQQKAALKQAIQVHPNRPQTQTRRWGTYYLTDW